MNLFKFKAEGDSELTDVLYENKNTRIERIVSTGQTSPENFNYNQDEDEYVVLLSGEAELSFFGESERLTMRAGDCTLIKAHHRHRVEYTSKNPPAVWLCVFSRPDGDVNL